jgi:hypothetical protein
MEQNQSVMAGELAVYPDLLLFSQERSKRLEGTVEVETGESVNQLEALAEWGVFSKLKAPFYLYVPPQCIDSARRLCDEHQFAVAEIWTYHLALDQVRFTQVYRSPNAPKPPPAIRTREKPAPPARRVAPPVAAAKTKAPLKAAVSRASRTAPAAAATRARPARPAPPPRAAAAKPKAKAAKPVAKAKAARKRR